MTTFGKILFGSIVVSLPLTLAACAGTYSDYPDSAYYGRDYGYRDGYRDDYRYRDSDACDRANRPAFCDYPVYRGSVVIGGTVYDGPFHYRDRRGYREYWFDGRWHRGRRG